MTQHTGMKAVTYSVASKSRLRPLCSSNLIGVKELWIEMDMPTSQRNHRYHHGYKLLPKVPGAGISQLQEQRDPVQPSATYIQIKHQDACSQGSRFCSSIFCDDKDRTLGYPKQLVLLTPHTQSAREVGTQIKIMLQNILTQSQLGWSQIIAPLKSQYTLKDMHFIISL